MKLAAAQVPPEFRRAKLVDEIDVEFAIAIHVGHSQTVPVIINDGLQIATTVIDNFVIKSDPGHREFVRELEAVKGGILL